ncbi:MAG: hypothetical protein AAGE37_10635 [Pseudomonadota bacterium]
MIVLVTIAVSLSAIAFLGWVDPKRRRVDSADLSGQSIPKRVAIVVSCLPGVVLVALGEWPEFFLWTGSVSVAGWAFVVWLNAIEQSSQREN